MKLACDMKVSKEKVLNIFVEKNIYLEFVDVCISHQIGRVYFKLP